jgi:hypothetical protein
MNKSWDNLINERKPSSEYKNEYKIHEINVRRSFRPDNYYNALREPLQEETTNK